MSSFEEYFYRIIANQIRKERCERKISNTAIIQLLDMWQITPADFYAFDEVYNWN